MRTPDKIMLDNGLKVEWLKKHDIDTYNGIRKSMDDFADQYAEFKINKLREREQNLNISDNTNSETLNVADASYSCYDCVHMASMQSDVVCHVWCTKTDRDFTFGNESTEICEFFEKD